MIILKDQLSPVTAKTGGTIVIGSGLTLTETSEGLPILQNASGGPAGTVSSGNINSLAWYAATGNTVDDLPTVTGKVLISPGGVPTWGDVPAANVAAGTLGAGSFAITAALTVGTNVTLTAGNLLLSAGFVTVQSTDTIILRLRSNAATVDVRTWDTRISAAGAYEIRSVLDNGTTVINAIQIAFATGNVTTTGTVSIGTTGSALLVGLAAGAAETGIMVKAAAGQNRFIYFASGSTQRWQVGATSIAEAGANAGSPFIIRAVDDGGTIIDTPLTITRAAGGTIAFVAGRPITGDTYNAQTISSTASFTGTVTVAGAANAPGITLTSGFYAFGTGGVSAYYTGVSPAMAYTTTGFPAPFNTAGNLLLQSRGDASRAIIFSTHNGTSVDWRWQISGAGHLLAQDDLYTIGASGTTRPNSVFVGTGAIVLGADPGTAGGFTAALRVGTNVRFQNVPNTFRADFNSYWQLESIANNQRLYLMRAETSFAARSAVSGGVLIGQILGQAFGTTAYQNVIDIRYYTGETISDTAAGGRVVFAITKATTVTAETPLKITTSQFDFFNTAAGPTMATTGGGIGVLWLGDAPTPPGSNPTGGVVIYSASGIFKTKDTSGNVVAMGDASSLYTGTIPSARVAGAYTAITRLDIGAAYTWTAGLVNLNGSASWVVGSSGLAATIESPRMYSAAYDKTLVNGRVVMFVVDNTISANTLNIGGNTSGGAAVTAINFFAASAVGTQPGTLKFGISNSLVTSAVDFAIGTIGTIDSAATPVADYSLVYNAATSKWYPRLINATVASSGDVNSGVLKDGTQSMYVQTLSGALSGTTTTPTISTMAVYKGFINTMTGLAANQLYILEYGTSSTTVTGTATGAQTTTTLKDTSKTWTTDQWIGYYVRLTGGTGSGQWRAVVSNTVDTLTIATWGTTPVAASTTYEISKYTWSEIGTSSANSATNGATGLFDTAKSWSPDALVTYQIYITSGTGAGQLRAIKTNTATKITIATTWTTNPDTSSTYVITQILSSADKMVHSITDSTLSYIYRVRILGAHANNFSAYGTGTLTAVSTQSFVNAFGVILASQIATAKLSSITSALGSVVADSLVVNDYSVFKGAVSLYSTSTADQFQVGGNAGTPYLMSDTHNRTVLSESGTIYVKGIRDASTNNTNTIIIGDYESVIGGFATQTFDPTDYDTGNVTFSQNSWSTMGSTVQVLGSTEMGSQVAVSGIYSVAGSCTITNTMTSVTGWTGDWIRVKASYVRVVDSVTVDLGVVTTVSGDLNVVTTASWGFNITDTTITSTGFTLTLTFECQSSYTKIIAGGSTRGSAQFASLSFTYASGTALTRRALYLNKVDNKPQITFIPVTTEPTNANTVDGEFWYGSTDHALRWNSNGTIYSLGLASTSKAGIVQLATHLGGTFNAPTVIGMQFSSGRLALTADSEDLVATANKGAMLATGDNGTLGWSAAPVTVDLKRPRGYFRASIGASATSFFTEGATNQANIGTATLVKDTFANWLRFATTTTTGNSNGVRGGTVYDQVLIDHNPTFYALITTDDTGTASRRLWVGLMSTAQTSASNDNLSGAGIALCFRAGGGSIIPSINDGTTTYNGTSLGTWAANSRYLVKIRVDRAGTCYFSINGGGEVTFTPGTFPTTSTALGWEIRVFNTASVAANFMASWVHCDFGRI